MSRYAAFPRVSDTKSSMARAKSKLFAMQVKVTAGNCHCTRNCPLTGTSAVTNVSHQDCGDLLMRAPSIVPGWYLRPTCLDAGVYPSRKGSHCLVRCG